MQPYSVAFFRHSRNIIDQAPADTRARMTRRDKLLARLKSRPRDLTWDELVRALEGLGYAEAAAGRTGGSRRRFLHPTAPLIALHKPHPGNIVKMYVIDNVIEILIEEGLL